MAGKIVYGGTMESQLDFFHQDTGIVELESKPNLLVLKPGEKGYVVDDLAPIFVLADAKMPEQKYVLLFGADRLRTDMQDKLLKVLEDSNIFFYLFCSKDAVLLATVRSRLSSAYLDTQSMEEDRANQIFGSIQRRGDLFEYLGLTEKDIKLDIAYQEFIRCVEQLFISLFEFLDGIVPSNNSDVVRNMSQCWGSQAEVAVLIFLCEDESDYTNYTKDDFFLFISKLARE